MSLMRWRKDRRRAQAALEESQRNLEAVTEQEERARNLRAALAKIRRENHLGPTFDAYLAGGRAT